MGLALGFIALAAALGFAFELHNGKREQDAALAVLADYGVELTALEIVRLGRGKVHRGSVYVALARLQAQGLVESRRELDGGLKRLYWATEAGRFGL